MLPLHFHIFEHVGKLGKFLREIKSFRCEVVTSYAHQSYAITINI